MTDPEFQEHCYQYYINEAAETIARIEAEKIDDIQINKMNDLKKYIYTKRHGDKVTLTINRNGVEFTSEVPLSTKIN